MSSQKKAEPKKRRIVDEGRAFNEEWTDEFFLGGGFVCFCQEKYYGTMLNFVRKLC